MIRWLYLNFVLRWLYRPTQRLLHRFNLHYMPPMYPERDKVLWCRWCGARYKVTGYGDTVKALKGKP